MTARIVPLDFYVYTHHKATTGEIFYVGKGTGDRAWKSTSRTVWWRSIVAKHGLEVRIAQDGLREWAAFELERDFVTLHGRRDLGEGPLVNLTDGGGGSVGCLLLLGRKLSPETIAKRTYTRYGDVAGRPPKVKLTKTEIQQRAMAAVAVPVVCNGTLVFPTLTAAARWATRHKGARGRASNISYSIASGAPRYGYTWTYADT